MNDKWFKFWRDYNLKEIREHFVIIEHLYSEPHRHYHTLEHIQTCLNDLEEVKNMLNHPLEVEFAIWYHDIIYNTQELDNEHRSAKLAIIHANKTDRIDSDLVYQMILTSKSHDPQHKNDFNYFNDIDMGILGSNPYTFEKYDCNIKKEYHWVPKSTFNKKRGDFLRSVLSRDKIYTTDYFYKKYEEKARENISSILDLKYSKK